MLIRIEKGSSVPITRQIDEQMRAQCLAGTLRPGERLPSVRELARELAVNVNTVFRVYERLVADRLIEMRHGDGTFVLPPSPSAEVARQLATQREQFAVEWDALIRRGLMLGLSAGDLRRKLNESLRLAGRRPENSQSAHATRHPYSSLEEKS